MQSYPSKFGSTKFKQLLFETVEIIYFLRTTKIKEKLFNLLFFCFEVYKKNQKISFYFFEKWREEEKKITTQTY